MQRPASSLRLVASPIANASKFKNCFTPSPESRKCATLICHENSGLSTGGIVNKMSGLKGSPKALPIMCMSRMDVCRAKAPSLLKLSFQSCDNNRLKKLEHSSNAQPRCVKLEKDKTKYKNIIDLNSPTRENILDYGLDGLPEKKPFIIGKGGFGIVLVAFRKGRKVAAKIITKRSTRRNSCEASVISEENGLGLHHPNLVQIIDIYGFRKLHAIIIMEFAGSRNLSAILDDSAESLNELRRLKFSLQIACGASWCHRNHIAHLDIKPANVIVSDSDWCKLGDFGCSVDLKNTSEHVYLPGGTVAYRAPELLNRWSEPTDKADIYSLGVTFWQILSRKIPFAGLDSHTIIYKVVAKQARPDEYFPHLRNVAAKYVDLYLQMWNQDPFLRPSIDLVVKGIKQLL